MTYQIIDNFAAGQDNRKSPLTSPAGTLTKLVNVVVTPGGELAKRRAFTQVAALAPDTFGLAATESSLWIFGRNVDPGLPPTWEVPNVTLKGVKIPNASLTLQQSDYDIFDGRVYLACRDPAQVTSATINPHYYVGSRGGSTTLYDGVLTEGTGKGFFIRTFKSKIYSVNPPNVANGRLLSFSAVGDPMVWTGTSNGSGFINLSLTDAASENLKSVEVYYDKLAIFSTRSTQIWAVAADPAQNAFDQLLRGSGTSAQRSPLQYGSGDVLFLDASGVRSLKAKDSSNSASVSDIGSPIDPAINEILLAVGKGQAYLDKAVAILEPVIGRFWMVFPDEILVLSYFPGPKITAWSRFTLPELDGYDVTYAATAGGRIFLKDSLNRLWVYGGTDGKAYADLGPRAVEVRMPYLDGKKPGHKKTFQAFDATVNSTWGNPMPTGAWEVAVSYDPSDPEQEEVIGTIDKPTWNIGASEMQGYDSHFSLRFYNSDALPATISNCAVHYSIADDEA